MARSRTRPAPVPEHNALIASAVRLPPIPEKVALGRAQQWQGQAWAYYDTVAELRFVANWVGNVMTRARLVVAKDVDGVLIVQTGGPAAEAMEAYFGGLQGQEQMLQQAGVHLTVGGEMWQVGTADGQWLTLGYNKVTRSGRHLKVDVGDGSPRTLGDGDFTIRVWTPHPTQPLYADSPVRSNLNTLAEIASLNAHVRAQLRSRLAGAGVLMVPSEIQFPVKESADPRASQAESFMQVLGEAMITPISEPDSPAALVPVVVTAPGEYLGDVKHLTFWSELDDKVIAMRDNAVKRLALGLDTPPEVLLGMSDTNHWNAWLVDEAAVKSHLEPRLGVICHATTVGYLRPAIEGLVPDPEDYYILADTSNIRLRPNRSKEAFELYDRGELNGEAMRRETGFNPDDAPDSEQHRMWLLRKIAAGSTSPEQTQAALRLLGADLGAVPGGTVAENPQITPVLDTKRSLEDHPENKVPDMERSTKDRESRDALLAACHVLVFRALERAGNRLLNGPSRAEMTDTPTYWRYLQADTIPANVLDGCWSFAAEVLDGMCPNKVLAAGALDGYVRYLLDNRVRHTHELMVSRLAQAGVG